MRAFFFLFSVVFMLMEFSTQVNSTPMFGDDDIAYSSLQRRLVPVENSLDPFDGENPSNWMRTKIEMLFEDKERKYIYLIEATNADVDVEEMKRISELFKFGSFKALLVLGASKANLIDEDFRERWGLGALKPDVEAADENGNFFKGPQILEFAHQSRISLPKWSDEYLATALEGWFGATLTFADEYVSPSKEVEN